MRNDDGLKLYKVDIRVMGFSVLLCPHQHCNWFADSPNREDVLGPVLCPEK